MTPARGAGRAPVPSGGDAAGDAGPAGNVEYRVAHLRERLAGEELGELGARVEVRPGSVLVTGTVPSAHCRETLLATVREELAGIEGIAVRCDVVVAENAAPDHAEELS
ncbi:BON domain-containing protein [Streptomyces griseoaurantiacus]|uniref:BON domain-containing protein n=1 Tax=Streptomyces griseoaurantiacus TaxID=68213 RepID=A0A7W2HXQ8_9ACTN|nr:BON domain-containing protein [Streptomyces griseoaurantiacus]